MKHESDDKVKESEENCGDGLS